MRFFEGVPFPAIAVGTLYAPKRSIIWATWSGGRCPCPWQGGWN